MKGELKINGCDAYEKWGATLGDGSLSALMAPAPMKEYVTNESPAAHGKAVATAASALPKVDSRDVQLTIYICAKTEAAFYESYASFAAELQGGLVRIETSRQPGVAYKCIYQSCSQFSQFNGRMAKFALRLTEPNPTDRNADD